MVPWNSTPVLTTKLVGRNNRNKNWKNANWQQAAIKAVINYKRKQMHKSGLTCFTRLYQLKVNLSIICPWSWMAPQSKKETVTLSGVSPAEFVLERPQLAVDTYSYQNSSRTIFIPFFGLVLQLLSPLFLIFFFITLFVKL